jgi:glyoxylase-like metal-dependent hydrolase (beta-lactamase superfamily II)
MRKHLTVAILLCSAAFVPYAQAQFAPGPAKLDTIKVKDDLYVIHNEFVPGNVTALITNEGVLLVDDKFEVDYANILAELKKITNQPVKYVINTHYHGDHAGGNAKFQAANAVVVASEQAHEKMVESKQAGLPNVTIQGTGRIYLGGKRVELYYFGRSHTDGDIIAYFPDHKVVAAGDMFTFGDATPQLIDYSGGGSAREWTKTLDGLLKLDFNTVVPGHGVVTTKAEVQKFRESTVLIRKRVGEMLDKKASREDIAKMLTTEFHWADLHLARGLTGIIAETR